jgi:hypothetical protein
MNVLNAELQRLSMVDESRTGLMGDLVNVITSPLVAVAALAILGVVTVTTTASGGAEVKKGAVEDNMRTFRTDVVDSLCSANNEQPASSPKTFHFNDNIDFVRVDEDGDLNATLLGGQGYVAVTPEVCEQVRICAEGQAMGDADCAGGGTLPGGKVSLEMVYVGVANRLAMRQEAG